MIRIAAEWAAYMREYHQKRVLVDETYRVQHNERARLWMIRNPERAKAIRARRNKKFRAAGGDVAWRRQLKLETLAAYGGKCACCGEAMKEFLSLDHVNGRGKVDGRGNREHGGLGFYARLRKAGWPQEDLRVLCLNCNCSLGFYGYCPHEGGSRMETI